MEELPVTTRRLRVKAGLTLAAAIFSTRMRKQKGFRVEEGESQSSAIDGTCGARWKGYSTGRLACGGRPQPHNPICLWQLQRVKAARNTAGSHHHTMLAECDAHRLYGEVQSRRAITGHDIKPACCDTMTSGARSGSLSADCCTRGST